IIAIDDTILGYFRQRNSYRRGLDGLIQSLSEKFNLSVVTGDNEKERPNLKKLFGHDSKLLFRQKPSDKLNVVRNLQKDGEHIAMIGDGLNDAGALQEAEVGIVISEDTANFTPACDVIMDARQFESMESLLDYSKDTIRVVLMAYGIALIYNIIGLGFAVQGLLSPVIAAILMPLSSVSIVLFGILMTAWFGKKRGFL
ncbi:MAG: HAD-IC family P-type ATPase, partial [Saprospiraceae bacterium]